MAKKILYVFIASFFVGNAAFADDEAGIDDKPCASIVQVCIDAGYTADGTGDKRFWNDCMKPLVMGKQVTGVSVNATDVKACRTAKIKKMQNELKELKSVKS